MSAAAAGFAHSTFYAHRNASPAFAREMRQALQEGYAGLEAALIAGFAPERHADDGWRRNDPPPIPAMTASQALQLLQVKGWSRADPKKQPHDPDVVLFGGWRSKR